MSWLLFSTIFIAYLSPARAQIWQKWQPWSRCNAECGPGFQVRTRHCLKLRPEAYCIGWFSSHKHCEAARPCGPEDPVCQEWGQWGECSRTCGVSTRAKYRVCTSNSNVRYRQNVRQLCSQSPCEISRAVWAEWGNWSACTNGCGQGKQFRVRVCHELVPGNAETCEGISTENRTCSEIKGCVSEEWSGWGSWSRCIGNCGRTGWMYRSRHCEHIGEGEGNCPGVPWKYQKCAMKCAPAESSTWSAWKSTELSKWKEWSAWSECSATCGGGVASRSRECQGGLKPGCDGHSSDSKKCGSAECKKVSVWNKWSNWSECTVTCGKGERKRVRTCSGEICEGRSDFAEDCSLDECPTATGCAGPEPIENGQVLGIKDAYKSSDVVAYLCDDGFNLEGDSGIICLKTGKWSHEAPSCVENGAKQDGVSSRNLERLTN